VHCQHTTRVYIRAFTKTNALMTLSGGYVHRE
jgi:hypothetical protein